MSRGDLREYLVRVVERWVTHPRQLDRVNQVLRRANYPLHPEASRHMGRFVLAAHEAAGGADQVAALEGAAAMELLVAASYALDNAMDQEAPPDSTPELEAAVGITLVFLAHASLEAVSSRSLDSASHTVFMADVHRLLLSTCAGQLEDLELPRRSATTIDEALEMTQLKAGSMGRLAGLIGASLAGAPADLAERIGEVCWNFVTYRQLMDDIKDAITAPEGGLTDADSGKRTLPLAYAAQWRQQTPINPESPLVQHRIIDTGPLSPQVIEESGAFLFTKIAAEVFRNKAIECAKEIHQWTGRGDALLEAVTADPHDSLKSYPIAPARGARSGPA